VVAAYEITDPTVDSQVVNLKSSGAEALLVAGAPKFAAQAIRKASEIGWKATILLNYPSSSVGATLKPAGLDKSTGVIVGTITMDPTDSQWDNNQGMKNFRSFVDKYMPGIDIADTNYLFGYTQGMLLEHLIRQCGNDLSRENIIKQAKSLKDVNSLKDAVSAGRKLGEDTKSTLEEAKKIAPQVTIFSNGDLSSFEVTLEREGGIRSVTIAIDEKGKVIVKPMVETRI